MQNMLCKTILLEGFHNFCGLVSKLSKQFKIWNKYFKLFGTEIFIVYVIFSFGTYFFLSVHTMWRKRRVLAQPQFTIRIRAAFVFTST